MLRVEVYFFRLPSVFPAGHSMCLYAKLGSDSRLTLTGWLLSQLDSSDFAGRTKNSLWCEQNIKWGRLCVKVNVGAKAQAGGQIESTGKSRQGAGGASLQNSNVKDIAYCLYCLAVCNGGAHCDSVKEKRDQLHAADPFTVSGVPNGSRTRVAGVKGRCPRPLDDGDLL